jgi:hypothetical protein
VSCTIPYCKYHSHCFALLHKWSSKL